jgi:predicted house-cleaning noncanonical NTP pyrophosphatase (MazG superfamily)
MSQTQWNTFFEQDNLTKTYESQRKDRLDDAVAEYLNDESITSLTLYNDLIDVLNEWGNYHRKHLENVTLALKLVNERAPRVDGDAVPSEVERPQGFNKRGPV